MGLLRSGRTSTCARRISRVGTLVLGVLAALVSCASGPELARESTNTAIVRVLRASRQNLEFEAEMLTRVDTLHTRPGDTLEVVFADRQTARVEVLEYDGRTRYVRIVFTEEGMRANFDDYVVGGAYLELRPDPNAVLQTGGAGAIDS